MSVTLLRASLCVSTGACMRVRWGTSVLVRACAQEGPGRSHRVLMRLCILCMHVCMRACVRACVRVCVCVCARARARVRAYGCKHAVCIRVCIRVSIWQRQERAARQGARSQSAEFWPRRTKIWDINAVRERRKHTAEFGLLKILLPFPVGGNNSVAILLQAHAQMRANKPSSATHQHLDALAIACAQ